MYAICGASGHIGGMVAEQLLKKGKKVRAIGRNAEHLKPLVDLGAEQFIADLADTKAITKAFKGVKAVFAMIPPNGTAPDLRKYQDQIGESLTKAIKDSGVKHVVNLSSMGAQNTTGCGPVTGLHYQEERLNKLSGVDVFHLRPTFFMENHLMQINTIKKRGVMASPQDPETRMPEIATKDIADHVVKHLTGLDWEGKVTRELLGPSDVTLNDVASAIGHAIGRDDLKYVRVSYDDTRDAMVQMGLSENVADNLIEMYKAYDHGQMKPTEPRSPENTTPTTINNWSQMFAQIYNR